jgi:hypothetical protein
MPTAKRWWPIASEFARGGMGGASNFPFSSATVFDLEEPPILAAIREKEHQVELECPVAVGLHDSIASAALPGTPPPPALPSPHPPSACHRPNPIPWWPAKRWHPPCITGALMRSGTARRAAPGCVAARVPGRMREAADTSTLLRRPPLLLRIRWIPTFSAVRVADRASAIAGIPRSGRTIVLFECVSFTDR